MAVYFAVVPWGHAGISLKDFGEIIGIFKTKHIADMTDRTAFLLKQLTGALYFTAIDEIDERFTAVLFKD